MFGIQEAIFEILKQKHPKLLLALILIFGIIITSYLAWVL